MVVEHVSPDGTRTKQSLVPKAWWFSEPEKLEVKQSGLLKISTTFSLWVLPGMHLDFSKLGIYHISYVHPWGGSEKDPKGPVFRLNRLTIVCVSQDRLEKLNNILRENSELALASYKFKNPLPSAVESPKYRREGGPKKINEAIKNGDKQDKVLLLLDSPGIVSAVESRTSKWDKTWTYETSSVGGYHVNFKDDHIVSKGSSFDCNGQCHEKAASSDIKDKVEKGGGTPDTK